MSSLLISPAERDYITKGVDVDIRADGRTRLDYRDIVLETGLISQASGSARCRIEGTDVLVGVKVEIGMVDGEKSNLGKVVCNVECAPSASQQFEGRGADELNIELTQLLAKVLDGPQGGINLEKLCIIPGAQCWVIYIDATILDYSGNILDALFIATRAALFNTRVPMTEVQDVGEGQQEFEIVDDVEAAERLEGWEQIPIAVTLNKIGSRYIVDASPLEELCTDARLTVAVNQSGNLCGVQKSGEGSIEPSLLLEMVQTGKTVGQSMIQQLNKKLEREEEDILAKESRGEIVKKLGFFAM
ncbi:ribosomal protein S5 domain 2-like protein [Basidiobolus meristosporus CBS 931.73]|uniref:Ribosomal RNA-processing protein 42 n=1 Tax=Basidiobolus meristosporus CBS 931.73 TaxID=1314790 RepID=A0A1Y1YTP9_9FUNG|nr:ribosomal protein S5 domain 2-like protein [Basidiobolus meristosporus CBS 931.73]|eukprot:ORY01413.1 ribosomal protein S5 domain 2-like protein [Basidiobolus meristosporus CBS 931.73]